MNATQRTYAAPAKGFAAKMVLRLPLMLQGLFFVICLCIVIRIYPDASYKNQINLILLCALYVAFLIIFMLKIAKGQHEITTYAETDGQYVTARCELCEKKMPVSSVKTAVFCTSETFSALVLLSDDDYLVINRPSAYMLLPTPEDRKHDYSDLVELLQEQSPHSILVYCSRIRKARQKIRLPRWIFEWDCYGKRAEKTVLELRRLLDTEMSGKFFR